MNEEGNVQRGTLALAYEPTLSLKSIIGLFKIFIKLYTHTQRDNMRIRKQLMNISVRIKRIQREERKDHYAILMRSVI